MINQVQTDLKLKISAQSRHPKYHDAYNRERHAYNPNYVNPEEWYIDLSAELPPDAERCRWQITSEDGGVDNQYEQEKQEPKFGRLTAAVPEPGTYTATLTVTGSGGQEYSQQRNIHLDDCLIVALGDSYFCGEGNPDVPGKHGMIRGNLACNMATFYKFLIEKANVEIQMEEEPVWQEPKVHRSYKSGASLAAEALEDREKGRVVTFLNFARSGASVDYGLCGPREEDDWTEMGQVEEAQKTVGDRSVDILIISVGGNDIHFSDRLLDLLRDDFPIIGEGGLLGDDSLNRQRELSEALRRLEILPEKFEKLAESITVLDPTHVFLTEYPVAQFDTVDEDGNIVTESGCGIFDGPDMDIDEKDAAVIRQSGEKLCETLAKMAGKHGWTLIDGIMEGFSGHGRCSEDKYFVSAEESCWRQGDFKGTLHPNEKGNKVYAQCIETTVKETLGFD